MLLDENFCIAIGGIMFFSSFSSYDFFISSFHFLFMIFLIAYINYTPPIMWFDIHNKSTFEFENRVTRWVVNEIMEAYDIATHFYKKNTTHSLIHKSLSKIVDQIHNKDRIQFSILFQTHGYLGPLIRTKLDG